MRPDCGDAAIQPQPGIGHDFVEQLRRNAAALRDLAMKYLDHLAGELVPVHDELPQTFGWKTTCMALSAMSDSISYDS